MIKKNDIERLRKSTDDASLYNYLYEQDTGFRDAADRVKPSLETANPLVRSRFPTAIINRHYFGTWELKKANPLTAQAAGAAMESAQDVQKRTQKSALGYVGETISNVPGSALQLGKDVLSAGVNVFNPDPSKNTVVGLGKAALGGAINTAETITGNEEMFNNPFGSEDVASQIGQFYSERYGSIDAAAETLKQDPIGFAADLATVLGGAGGLLRGAGAVSKAAGLTKAGQMATKAGRAIDPLSVTGKIAGGTARIAGDALSPGKAAERLVNSSLGITKSDAVSVAEKAGKSAGRVVLDGDQIGPLGTNARNIGQDMKTSAKTSKGTLDEGLKAIKKTYKNDSAKQALTELQDFYSDTRGNEDIAAKIKGLVKEKEHSLEEINDIKRMLGDTEQLYRRSGDVKAGAKAEGLANIYGKLKTFIENSAKQEGFGTVEALNNNTQVTTGLSKAIEKGAAGGMKNNVVRITDYVAAGIGGIAGGPVGTAVGFGLNRIVGSQRFKTALAYYLNKLSAQELQKLEQAITGNNFSGDAGRILKKVIDQAKKESTRMGTEVISIPERSE